MAPGRMCRMYLLHSARGLAGGGCQFGGGRFFRVSITFPISISPLDELINGGSPRSYLIIESSGISEPIQVSISPVFRSRTC